MCVGLVFEMHLISWIIAELVIVNSMSNLYANNPLSDDVRDDTFSGARYAIRSL
jgi:hypothetical protein